MKTSRRSFLLAGAAATATAAVAGTPGVSFGQAKTVLKASDVHPIGYPTVEAVERLGKKLEQQTNGRYSVQMFPSMQLGGEKEAIEQAQVGALQFARISVGVGRPDRRRAQRLQHAVRVPRREAHAQGDRRPDRHGAAGQDHQQSADPPDRPVLDGWRRAQRLQQGAADPHARGPEGPEDPHDGQPALRRHHERAWAATASPWAWTRSTTR